MTINDAADVSTTIVKVSSTDGDDKDAATVIDIHSLPRDVFGRIKLDVESQKPSTSIARISHKESTMTTTTVEETSSSTDNHLTMTVDDCLNATIMIPAGVVLATPIGEPLAMATRPVQEIESQRVINPSTTIEHSIIISTVDNHLTMTVATTDAVAVAVVVESSQEQQTLPSQYRVWWRRRIRRWLRQHEEATTTLVEKCYLCLTVISKFYNIFIFGCLLFVILGGFVFKIFNKVIGVIVLVSVHFMMNCAFCAFGVD
jgi:hypothetical protein